MKIETAYREIAPKLHSYLTGNGCSYATACDIVQETFLRLWKRREELSDDLHQVSGLAFTIARNYRNDLARKARHETLGVETNVSDDEQTDDNSPADAARPGETAEESAALTRRLKASLAKMPVQLLETFALSRLSKLTARDIARGTGTSEANVKVRVHRARELFKSYFAEHDESCGRGATSDGAWSAELKAMMMLAAVDGDIAPDELSLYRSLAQEFRGTHAATFDGEWQQSVQAMAYIGFLTEILPPEEIVREYVREAGRIPRQFVELLEKMAGADGDYSEIERACISALVRRDGERRNSKTLGILALCAFALGAAATATAGGDTCLLELHPTRLSVHAPPMTVRPKLALKGWQAAPVRVRAERHEGFAVTTNADGTARVTFRTAAEKSRDIEEFVLSATLDLVSYAGGELYADGARHALPVDFGPMFVAKGKARQLTLVTADGNSIDLRFRQPTGFLLQDDRAFGVSSFALRLALTDEKRLVADAEYATDFTVSSPRGMALGAPKPVVITAGDDWVPFRATPEIAAGTALDFSGLCGTNAPCGAYGRVIAVGEHFEFEKLPGVRQRFYGANLCFTANFLEPAESRKLVANLRRVGYNAVRIHHHDGGLVQGMPDSTTLNAQALDRLDALLAACSEAGIYITTDLFVSREVPYREVGIDRKGRIGNMPAKTMVRENAQMRENYFRFVRNWLGHVNPYTRRRLADEPALAWISFINEGNPGNPGCGASDRATLMRELEMDRAIKAFVRDELGCRALVTSMNGWSNVAGTSWTRATVYDYVDDHYYFDHPEYINNDWSVPSRCSNILPFADSRLGKMSWRVFGKPFTISEFNYCYPSVRRGCGGLVMGAMAALQDWGALWRFAWSHSAEGVRHYEARWSKFFDTSADPTELASERAAVSLFRRGDLAPLEQTAAWQLNRDYLGTDAAYGNKACYCADLIWYRRLGIAVGDLPAGSRALAVDDERPANPAAWVTDEERRASPVRVDTKKGIFAVDTPRTQGAFLREGMVTLSGLTVGVKDSFATVWATSLDGQPLNASARILVSHITETVNSECAFSDKTRTVMTAYGHVPHLMRRGRAACRLAVGAGDYRLYALGGDGRRVAELPCRREGDRLRFVMDVCAVPDTATCCYEIVRTTAANGGAFTPSQPDNGVNRITKEKP